MDNLGILVNLGMTYANGIIDENDKNTVAQVSDIITQYLTNKISFEEGCARLEAQIGSSDPIKKLAQQVKPNAQMFNGKKTPFNQKMNTVQIAGYRKKARSWSPEEDQRLITAIQNYGTENWPLVAQYVGGGRLKSQCSQRWHRVLDPKITKCVWSREEEEKLLQAVAAYGNKAWTRIASEMGDRSDVQCRYRYKFLMKKARDTGQPLAPVAVPQIVIQTHQNVTEHIVNVTNRPEIIIPDQPDVGLQNVQAEDKD